MKKLEEYLSGNYFNRIIDHAIRATANNTDEVAFYIHPINANGDTLDFQVIGNTLIPLTNDLTKPEALDFGQALSLCKRGVKIARKGWNGKGMFVVYQKGYPQGIKCNKQTAEAWGMNEGDLFKCEPYLQIQMVNGSHSMWVPSTNDLLAEDWNLVK